jgi:CTP synthase
LKEGSLASRIYGGAPRISERHRHRYEVNQKYLPALTSHGLTVSGLSPDGKFVEIVELAGHPWFLGCQFHPEYKSKPTEPHPLFVSYIAAALAERRRRQEQPAVRAEAPEPARELEPVRAGAAEG